MPQYWMISNRNVQAKGLGSDRDELTYWVSDNGPLDNFNNWTKVSADRFQKLLVASANKFPLFTDPADQEKQQHVCLFVHGYNNTWADACRRYESLAGKLFTGDDGLGLMILFSWPSDGMATNYLPDRADAVASAAGFADVLSAIYEWLLLKQQEGNV